MTINTNEKRFYKYGDLNKIMSYMNKLSRVALNKGGKYADKYISHLNYVIKLDRKINLTNKQKGGGILDSILDVIFYPFIKIFSIIRSALKNNRDGNKNVKTKNPRNNYINVTQQSKSSSRPSSISSSRSSSRSSSIPSSSSSSIPSSKKSSSKSGSKSSLVSRSSSSSSSRSSSSSSSSTKIPFTKGTILATELNKSLNNSLIKYKAFIDINELETIRKLALKLGKTIDEAYTENIRISKKDIKEKTKQALKDIKANKTFKEIDNYSIVKEQKYIMNTHYKELFNLAQGIQNANSDDIKNKKIEMVRNFRIKYNNERNISDEPIKTIQKDIFDPIIKNKSKDATSISKQADWNEAAFLPLFNLSCDYTTNKEKCEKKVWTISEINTITCKYISNKNKTDLIKELPLQNTSYLIIKKGTIVQEALDQLQIIENPSINTLNTGDETTPIESCFSNITRTQYDQKKKSYNTDWSTTTQRKFITNDVVIIGRSIEGGMEKNDKGQDFFVPTRGSGIELTNSENIKINKNMYFLRSIICHGGSTTGGHYIAYVKYEDDWFYTSDRTVNKVKFNKLIEESKNETIYPYALMYTKENNTNKGKPIGIINPGMLCYLNSTMQALLALGDNFWNSYFAD
jgi:hypothetical protein